MKDGEISSPAYRDTTSDLFFDEVFWESSDGYLLRFFAREYPSLSSAVCFDHIALLVRLADSFCETYPLLADYSVYDPGIDSTAFDDPEDPKPVYNYTADAPPTVPDFGSFATREREEQQRAYRELRNAWFEAEDARMAQAQLDLEGRREQWHRRRRLRHQIFVKKEENRAAQVSAYNDWHDTLWEVLEYEMVLFLMFGFCLVALTDEGLPLPVIPPLDQNGDELNIPSSLFMSPSFGLLYPQQGYAPPWGRGPFNNIPDSAVYFASDNRGPFAPATLLPPPFPFPAPRAPRRPTAPPPPVASTSARAPPVASTSAVPTPRAPPPKGMFPTFSFCHFLFFLLKLLPSGSAGFGNDVGDYVDDAADVSAAIEATVDRDEEGAAQESEGEPERTPSDSGEDEIEEEEKPRRKGKMKAEVKPRSRKSKRPVALIDRDAPGYVVHDRSEIDVPVFFHNAKKPTFPAAYWTEWHQRQPLNLPGPSSTASRTGRGDRKAVTKASTQTNGWSYSREDPKFSSDFAELGILLADLPPLTYFTRGVVSSSSFIL